MFIVFIADCRICVWNASDGSLVHSLIGHKESVSNKHISCVLCIMLSFCECYIVFGTQSASNSVVSLLGCYLLKYK